MGGEGEGKTRGHKLPTDGPDHEVKGSIPSSIGALHMHAGANVSFMVLQGCKSSSQKSTPLESGHWRHGVWIRSY